jgi:replication factor C subunit 1
VDEVIEYMDDYYLNRESRGTIVQLGADTHKDVDVLKKITAATKCNFTRKYVSCRHQAAFSCADKNLGTMPRSTLCPSTRLKT